MDIVIKLNEQTIGRDRIIRLLQYGSRAYWYYGQNIRSTQHSAEVLRSLEYTFSSFRKLLRLGRCLDSLYSALKMMKYPDLTIRAILTLSKIANALFLLTDHIIWVGRVGLYRVNIEKWSKISNKYWLMGIIMNLIRDIYEIIKIFKHKKESVLMRTSKFSYHLWNQCKLLYHLRNHKDVVMDTIKNGCDLCIPLTALGFTKFTPGTIGILGVVSSIVSLYTLTYPLYKLRPT
ncbi:peroxisomal membrane protein 11B isoform X1 [Bombus pyrosoma]|uniref:peroxisomal membrane protein 11B isoform X1 n=1 Tax=Bombus pyrosoma TaxID=396416 RepID=UPI001CB8BA7E|nr:peroxisomal membrane protein 11B isoform X1 [Bombus pyrosoma]